MNERFMLNMGGVEFDVESDLPVSVDAGAYCDFHGAGSADTRVSVRLTTAEFRGENRLIQVFDADGAWKMFSDGTDRVFRSGVAGAPLWTAVLDKDFAHATVHCGDRLVRMEKGLKTIENPIRYPLDQILMMYVLARGRGMILHGCGVDFRGKGLLFLGKSGAGKSTLARLLAGKGGCRLLSDDRIIVRCGVGGGFRMFGTPWPGEASVAENSGVALDALFFLSHAAGNEIKPLVMPEAVARLLQVVSIPWHDAEVFPDAVSFCDRLLRTAPAYELRFAPSSAVAAVIEGWAGCSKQAPECAREEVTGQQDMQSGDGDQPAIRPVKPYCAGAAPEQDDAAEHSRCGYEFGRTGSSVRANFEKSLSVLAELPADAVGDGSSGFRAAQGNVADPDALFGERMDGEFVAVMDKGEHAGAVGGEAQGIAPAEDVGGEPGEVGAGDAQEVGCHRGMDCRVGTGGKARSVIEHCDKMREQEQTTGGSCFGKCVTDESNSESSSSFVLANRVRGRRRGRESKMGNQDETGMNIEHPTSNIQHRTSNVERTSVETGSGSAPAVAARRSDCVRAIAIVASAILTGLTVLDARAEDGASSSTNDAIETLMPPAPRRRPLVVLAQATIRGRVLLVTEEDGEGKETAAAKLPIEVCLPGESEPICKTQTEKDGVFSLPNLGVGKYVLKVGRLMLEVLVQQPLEGPTYARRIPKTILIFMPASLKE